MKINQLTNAQLTAVTLTGADLYSLAKARYIPLGIALKGQPAGTDRHVVYINQYASGSPLFNTLLAENFGGTQDTESVDFPSFYPVATKGAECAAVVSSLTWANKNLVTGFEFMYCVYSATSANNRYFVSGILNSSQTLSNDPFGTQGVADGLISGLAACWSSGYEQGVNPFI